MKAQLATSLAIAALSSLASAQQYPLQTTPFTLSIKQSSNPNLIGSFLYACHSGAAIEQLCVSDNKTPQIDDSFIFRLNYSDSSSVKGVQAGALTWDLTTQSNDGPLVVSEPLTLAFVPFSNVANVVFEPGTSYNVAPAGFDPENFFFLYSTVDYAAVPPADLPEPKIYYNWFVCQTLFGGYKYQALTWVTAGEPINPSCVSVAVTRTLLLQS